MTDAQLRNLIEAARADQILQNKLEAARGVADFCKIAEEAGFTVSETEISVYFEKSFSELKDSELEDVAGGSFIKFTLSLATKCYTCAD